LADGAQLLRGVLEDLALLRLAQGQVAHLSVQFHALPQFTLQLLLGSTQRLLDFVETLDLSLLALLLQTSDLVLQIERTRLPVRQIVVQAR